MAYKIEYSPESGYLYPLKKTNEQFSLGKWLGITVLIVGILWIKLNGVPDFLIPGDPVVTKEASAVLIADIKEGIPVENAVETFCRSILDGAGI